MQTCGNERADRNASKVLPEDDENEMPVGSPRNRLLRDRFAYFLGRNGFCALPARKPVLQNKIFSGKMLQSGKLSVPKEVKTESEDQLDPMFESIQQSN